jgi:hypothetical protein
MANRALVVNVGVSHAETNVRKIIATSSLSFLSLAGRLQRENDTLIYGASKVYNPTDSQSAITILRCTKPVTVAIKLLPLVGTRVAAVTVTQVVNSFLLIDDLVGSVTVTNNLGVALDATSADILFIQS